MKVIISTSCCWIIEKPVILWLYTHYPEMVERVSNSGYANSAFIYSNLYPCISGIYWKVKQDFSKDEDALRVDDRMIEAHECVYAELKKTKIVEIPDGVQFYVSADEGCSEVVHEKHRIWS